MLKFHPIPAFMKTYTNFKKIFLVRVFWLKYIFPIKFKIPILDLMLLPKNMVQFEGVYSSRIKYLAKIKMLFCYILEFKQPDLRIVGASIIIVLSAIYP